MSDFLLQDLPFLGQRWNWKDHRELDLGVEEERYLRKILENQEVSFSREEDELVWCGAKSGSYSMKVGVSLLESEDKMKEWEAKVCWNSVCLLRVGAFS